MANQQENLDLLCVNTIRFLATDAVQRANSGHPGLPLGAAPMAYALWQYHLRHNPRDASWPDRDRFVLSAGHGSALLYALLHVTGYPLSLDDLKSFRQWNSRTPGHPETFKTNGVEAVTGPLGQGSANAVGMAVAERMLANRYNRPGHSLVDHRTYAIVSDGDLMEGVNAEAASLAGHLKLGKLIYLYDANQISLDGPTSLAFDEDVGQRFAAYGWHVQNVAHGDTDLTALRAALTAAEKNIAQPSIIIVKTTIGFGSPNKQGTSAAHGSPLGEDELKLTKKALGWDPDKSFYVPPDAGAKLQQAVAAGQKLQSDWQARLEAYTKEFPDLAKQWHSAHRAELPAQWDTAIPTFKPGDKLATREASGKILNGIADKVPWLVGGDADLSVSTLTSIKSSTSFDGTQGSGRNIRFGVREHAMGAIANGIAYHQGLRPYVSTFFVFSDYMRPAVRLAALGKLPITYVWTHDSIGLGEDGPTHQPVEHLMSLRAMPQLLVLRPADALETVEAWKIAMTYADGPVALVLSRQKLATLDYAALGCEPAVSRGAYTLVDPAGGSPQAIIIATGSEVQLACAAQKLLASEGLRVRVVSMPSCELFAKQDAVYRERVLPAAVTARLAIEAGVTLGWQRWVGSHGLVLGLDRFGASAPAEILFEQFGFTPRNAADMVQKMLKTAH